MTRLRLLIVLLTALALGAGCCKHAMSTEGLDPDDLAWTTLEVEGLGVRLSVPEDFKVREDGEHERSFWFAGDRPARVLWLSEEQGRGRGLWFGHRPAGETTLGGKPGERYVYNHHDGPFCGRMMAYVVPYRDQFLALELAGPREPDAVQQRILASFAFTDE